VVRWWKGVVGGGSGGVWGGPPPRHLFAAQPARYVVPERHVESPQTRYRRQAWEPSNVPIQRSTFQPRLTSVAPASTPFRHGSTNGCTRLARLLERSVRWRGGAAGTYRYATPPEEDSGVRAQREPERKGERLPPRVR